MKITVQPELLAWARDRVGLSEELLAKKLGAKPAQVVRWEDDGELTYKRAEKLAKVTRIPFGYLFLPEPPDEKLPVADFRTVGSEEGQRPSPELLDVLFDAMRKQSWYRDYLLEMEEEPLHFVGSMTVKESPVKAADTIARVFDFSTQSRREASTWEQALTLMFDRCDEAGVLVLRSGVAGGNPHRPLEVEEFRGFALADAYAPLVFINSKDSPAAQMFTLVHELVHLWLGVSGVSNLEHTYAPGKRLERFCNQVAAEVLVPAQEVKRALLEHGQDLGALRRHFKVSVLVLLRRLKDIGEIDDATFQELYDQEEESFRLKRQKQKADGKSQGNYYATQRVRVSPPLARAVIGSALEGKTPYREAYSLLGIKKAETFKKFAQRLEFMP